MEIDFINGLLREELEAFKLSRLRRGWDMLMLVESGFFVEIFKVNLSNFIIMCVFVLR